MWQALLNGSPRGGQDLIYPPPRRMTPADVERTRFTTTRLMPGYSMDEVDAFLDQVRDEMARLIRERDEARAFRRDSRRLS